ncbi:MAG: hypothetical protein E6G00_08075 [Actinobacteria bacterium]|nr:MAG: hypothetical protein E6G00_08075 [Actinomycetota bacterium]
MRRLGISVAVVLAGLVLLPAAAAQATFHLNKVNEVMLASASGDSNVRFVEYFDPSSEPYPPTFAPYGLAIYDAAGHKLGSQTLTASKLASASGTRPFLISTPQADAAFGVTGDETLTVTLPKTAGQACYYSCITWGCITSFVSTSGTGSFHGAVPANGMSAQRQSNDSVQIANPTPKATNVSGTSPTICPGGGGGGGSAFAGVKIPKQTAKVKKGKAPVSVSCPAKAKTSCVGKLVLKTAKAVTTSSGKKKVVTLGKASFSIAAGKTKVLKVKLSKGGKNLLAAHKTVKSIATATAHDATGKSKTTSGKVKVKRG